jgi:hypothetical protein
VCGSSSGLKKFKMAAVAMVTKVQTMLNSLRTADPFETWAINRSFKVVLFVFKIFKIIFLAFWPFHGNGDHFENSKS